MRTQLENQGHVQHVVDIVQKISNPEVDVEPDMLARYKVAIDTKMKLINKYLPDIKEVFSEVTGENGGPLQVQVNVRD